MSNLEPNTKQLRVKRKAEIGYETLAYQYDGDFIKTGGAFYCPQWVENSYNQGSLKFKDQGDLYMENPVVRKGYPPEIKKVEPGDYFIKCVGIDYAYFFVKEEDFEVEYEILEEIEARPKNAERKRP